MSNPYLPPGADRVERFDVEYRCRACQHTWEVPHTRELGGTFADNDADCEECPGCGSPEVVEADDPLARVPLEEEPTEEELHDEPDPPGGWDPSEPEGWDDSTGKE